MSKTLLGSLLALLLVFPAFAQDKATEPADTGAEAATDEAVKEKPAPPKPMDMTKMGPCSRKIKNPKKIMKEIRAFLKKDDQLMKTRDLAAAMELIDFPVFMATDDSKGEASGMTATSEEFEAMMKPFYDQAPPKGMKMSRKNNIILLTGSLAQVVSNWTIKMGKKKMKYKSVALLIKKDGKWKAKAVIEGGWGDMMGEKPAP